MTSADSLLLSHDSCCSPWLLIRMHHLHFDTSFSHHPASRSSLSSSRRLILSLSFLFSVCHTYAQDCRILRWSETRAVPSSHSTTPRACFSIWATCTTVTSRRFLPMQDCWPQLLPVSLPTLHHVHQLVNHRTTFFFSFSFFFVNLNVTNTRYKL